MKRNQGFITTMVLLIITFGALYVYFISLKTPNRHSQQLAALIGQYPNSSSWEVNNSKGFCFFLNRNCLTPAKITFESQDPWVNIYNNYRQYLTSGGWQTNSVVITSIPSQILFTDGQDCQIELAPKPNGFAAKTEQNVYLFKVNCIS